MSTCDHVVSFGFRGLDGDPILARESVLQDDDEYEEEIRFCYCPACGEKLP